MKRKDVKLSAGRRIYMTKWKPERAPDGTIVQTYFVQTGKVVIHNDEQLVAHASRYKEISFHFHPEPLPDGYFIETNESDNLRRLYLRKEDAENHIRMEKDRLDIIHEVKTGALDTCTDEELQAIKRLLHIETN